MSNRILIVGGIQEKYALLKWRLKLKSRTTLFATLDTVDLDSEKFETIFKTENADSHGTTDGGQDNKFTSASLLDNQLLCCSGTAAFVYSWPALTLELTLTHTFLNDVHHIALIDNKYYIANTGLDSVVVFSKEGTFEKIVDVSDGDIWERFDKEKDYRKVETTKPHLAHPNHVFECNGKIWATRFNQKDAVNIFDKSEKFNIEIESPHDGMLHQGKLYFTTVDGKVVYFDLKNNNKKEVIDLYRLFNWEAPMGWCRGISIKENIAVIGFSALRQTKIERNLDWMKGTKNRNENFFLAVIDLKAVKAIKMINIPHGFTDVIFSVHHI